MLIFLKATTISCDGSPENSDVAIEFEIIKCRGYRNSRTAKYRVLVKYITNGRRSRFGIENNDVIWKIQNYNPTLNVIELDYSSRVTNCVNFVQR
ncbi:hypothetical protein TNIN_412321 [Trichonephila inaurata madagascariensis]|uniref:Uncharacterized protein n=1 Tax=Trichonephila inaurata madagascariensis TaxID=2747483 RepID=A0A8X6XPG5_9ARAC|nr:hypothetical protein TNIN_412321 [Trichonephila inaurata madagascariensis]